MEKAIWEYLGKPLVVFFWEKLKGETNKRIKRGLLRKYKKDFIKRIETTILTKYGNRTFYHDLSCCLFANNTLEKLFDRCYQRALNDFKLNDDIIYEVLETREWRYPDYLEAKRVLENILEAVFATVNSPSNDTERKLTNLISTFRDMIRKDIKCEGQKTREAIHNDYIELKSSIDLITSQGIGNIPCDTIVDLLNDDQHIITLSSKTPAEQFMISIWIEYTQELRHFESGEQLLGFINFSGSPLTVNATKIICIDEKGNQIQNYGTNSYEGPTLKLGDFNLPTLEWHKNLEDTHFDKIKLKISPQIAVLEIDIQNENREVLVQNLKQGISRKKLSNRHIEARLEDIRETTQVKVIFVNELDNHSIYNSSITLMPSDKESVYSNLLYYRLLKQFVNSKELFYYDSKTGLEVGRAKGPSIKITNEEIDNNISLFEKLNCIQNYFKIKYTVPDKISEEDIYWINVVYKLIQSGFVQIGKCTLKVAQEDMDICNDDAFENSIRNKEPFMMQVHYQYIQIWNIPVNFEDDLLMVIPEAYCEVNNDKTISIYSAIDPILTFKTVNPELDIQALADIARQGNL